MNHLSNRTARFDVRGLSHHINEWGDESKPLLIMLHGWMDCGASFKYMAPYLSDSFHIVAPDLRGFGDTEHDPNGYWFPDYLADLEVIVERYSPTQKVNLVGHSMGGHIALMYSGIMNDRVQKVMTLDALGLPDTQSSDAPDRYRRWIKETLSKQSAKVYVDSDQLKASIKAVNPELSEALVDELCELWARPIEQGGGLVLKHDHKHRYINPQRYIFSDVTEIWKQIQASVAIVLAAESWHYKQASENDRINEAKKLLKIREENYFLLEQAGHMLHLEHPQATAACIEKFFLD